MCHSPHAKLTLASTILAGRPWRQWQCLDRTEHSAAAGWRIWGFLKSQGSPRSPWLKHNSKRVEWLGWFADPLFPPILGNMNVSGSCKHWIDFHDQKIHQEQNIPTTKLESLAGWSFAMFLMFPKNGLQLDVSAFWMGGSSIYQFLKHVIGKYGLIRVAFSCFFQSNQQVVLPPTLSLYIIYIYTLYNYIYIYICIVRFRKQKHLT